MNRNRPWAADDDRRLIELRATGRTVISVAAALRRSAGAVEGRIYLLKKRKKKADDLASGLKSMASFNPYEPAFLHDRVTDKLETWIGGEGADFRERAIFDRDGTVRWKEFVFDGWCKVLVDDDAKS